MKTRVGVFFGGKSVEHEVSVISAMQAIAALNPEKYEAVPVYMTKAGEMYTGKGLGAIEAYRDIPALLASAQRVDLERHGGDVWLMRRQRKLFSGSKVGIIDVALLVFHGTAGEDGAVQGLMETLGLPYTGCDVHGSACGMDKWTMKALFAAAGIPHLGCIKVRRGEYFENQSEHIEKIEAEIGYPLVVKPVNLGSSVGIGLARNREELELAMEDAMEYAMAAICEKAVEPLREINCSVLGDGESARASVCEEPVLGGAMLSYADKYQRGQKGGKDAPSAVATDTGAKGGGMSSLARRVPADLPEEVSRRVQSLAVEAFRAVGAAGVSRVDFLMKADTGDIWVNEINTIPGSLSFYLWEASGKPFAGLLDDLISLALKRRRQEDGLKRSFDTNLLAGASLGGGKGIKGG